MTLKAENIFIIPLFDQWILHAPLHGVTALVNKACIEGMRENWLPKGAGKLSALLETLSKSPSDVPGILTGPPDPVFLGIIPTRNCNMSCNYCAFGAQEVKPFVMDHSVAVYAVDWMASYVKTRGKNDLNIHFFGGEPFYAPDLIKTVVRRAVKLSEKNGLTSRFHVSTNGFFDKKWCHFIGNYFNSVVLSFDGPEEIQDLHRPLRNGNGSFRTVSRNAALLAESPTELSIRICVTQDSVSSLDQISKWFCETFRPSFLDFESLQPTDLSERAGLTPPNPWEFAKMVYKASIMSRSYGVTPIYNSASINSLRSTFCPVGKDAMIVSPDGQINACYLLEEDWIECGLDLRLGKLSPDGTVNMDMDAIARVRKLTELREDCRTCFCRWYCAGGCHVSRHSGKNRDIHKNFCIQTRILTVCNLLEQLGCREEADKLINSREAMEKIAFQCADSLRDWGEPAHSGPQ